jgi:histidinol-phosphate aminotransferase
MGNSITWAMAMRRRDWLLAAAGTAVVPALVSAQRGAPLRLSLNENAFGPLPRVQTAVLGEFDRLHRYVDQEEVDALRRRVAVAGIAIGKPFPPLERWLRITVGTPDETDRVIAVLTSQEPR